MSICFDSRLLLIYWAVLFQGDYLKMMDAITNKKDGAPADEVEKVCKSVNSRVVTILDYDYPKRLKRSCFRPPIVLFYHGDLSLLDDDKHLLGVVGSRKYSEYGKEATNKVVGEIVRDVVTVSGLAYGIDSIAHQASINSGGRTIAVLGSGINNCYPKENQDLYEEIKKNHLIISEYPDMTTPAPEHFPIRNRIVAALSDAVLVPQINTYQSGTNITINLALEMHKEVFAIPHPIGEEEPTVTNALINEGATLVENGKDIIESMKWGEKK